MAPDEFKALLSRLIKVLSQVRNTTTDIDENITLVANLQSKVDQLSKSSGPLSLDEHIAQGLQLKETATDHLKAFLQARTSQLEYMETATRLVANQLQLEWTEHRYAQAERARSMLEKALQPRSNTRGD